MKKLSLHISIIILVFFSISTFGQKKQSLTKQLWERVQSCYTSFEDDNDDGKLDDVIIIDDAKNGYLKVTGAIGTCGCICTKTTTAFKAKNGNYTFLDQEKSACSWLHKTTSNRNLTDILPENFGVQSFIPSAKDTLSKKAIFFLDFNIPQYGTETQVTLQIIPYGMNIKNDNILICQISENDDNTHLEELSFIPQLYALLNSKSIDLILNNQESNLPKKDVDLIITQLKKNGQKFTLYTFGNKLRELKRIYDLYTAIEHKSILLKWNKEKEKFYINKKEEAVKSMTFEEFLNNEAILKFWMAIC